MKQPDRSLPSSRSPPMGLLLNPDACHQIDSRCTRIGLSHCQRLIFRLEAMEANLGDVIGMWRLRDVTRDEQKQSSDFPSLSLYPFKFLCLSFFLEIKCTKTASWANHTSGQPLLDPALVISGSLHHEPEAPLRFAHRLEKGVQTIPQESLTLVAGCGQQQKTMLTLN